MSAARRERFGGNKSQDPSVRSKDKFAAALRNPLRPLVLGGATSGRSQRSIVAVTGLEPVGATKLTSGDPSIESYLKESSSPEKKTVNE